MCLRPKVSFSRPGAPSGLSLCGAVLALSVLLAQTLAAHPVKAQVVEPQLSTWDVQIWPEYDQPAVLVIESGALSDATIFPFQVRSPLPPGATVHAVAYPGAAGNLLALPWSVESDAAGQVVVFDVDQPRFVIEYYADILTPPPSRGFELPLITPYTVQQASLTLRQPARASDLLVTPAMNAAGPDSLGNPTYTLDLGALDAGASVPVQVSYSKADDEPSVVNQPASAAPASVGSPNDDGQNWWLLAGGIVVGLLAGVGVLYLLQRRRSVNTSRQARRRNVRQKGSSPVRQPEETATTGPANKFCVQCGRKFEVNDKFCRNCGAQRR